MGGREGRSIWEEGGSRQKEKLLKEGRELTFCWFAVVFGFLCFVLFLNSIRQLPFPQASL